MMRRNRDNLGVLLLVQHLLFTVGLENIPPVTLGAIGLQIVLFLGMIKVRTQVSGLELDLRMNRKICSTLLDLVDENDSSSKTRIIDEATLLKADAADILSDDE